MATQKKNVTRKKPQAKKARASAKKTAGKTAAKKPALKTSQALTNLPLTNSPKEMEKLMTKNKAQIDQMVNETANLSRECMEALVKSSSIFAKGCDEILRTYMGLAQNAAEKQGEALKKMMAMKSLDELTELQNKTAQKNYDEFVANATKISEMSVRTLTESAEPINNQINKAVQKASQAMAA